MYTYINKREREHKESDFVRTSIFLTKHDIARITLAHTIS